MSLGEFVAHLLPVSGVDHIEAHFTAQYGRPLRKALSELRPFVEPPLPEWVGSVDDEIGEEPERMIGDVDALYGTLGNLYTARHIAAHEAEYAPVTRSEAERYLSGAQLFVDALDELVEQTLHPGESRNAMGESLRTVEQAGEAQEQAERVFYRLRGLLGDDPAEALRGPRALYAVVETLEQAQAAFESYVEAESAFEVAMLGPASGLGNAMRSTYARVSRDANEARRQRLQEVLNDVVAAVGFVGDLSIYDVPDDESDGCDRGNPSES